MKKIVNKKVYDTKTATEVASWHLGSYMSELSSYAEALFLTKKGSWFLWGEGGPLSKYATFVGDDRSGSEDIEVLSPKEAYTWLEKTQNHAAIYKYFSPEIEEG